MPEGGGAPRRTARGAATLAGVVAAVAFAGHAALSWLLAPFATYEGRPYGQFEFFARIGEAIPWLQGRQADGLATWKWGVQLALRGRGPFEIRDTFLIAYAIPQIVATLAALALLRTLWVHRERLQPDIPDRLLRWGILFALLSVVAVPVLVPDFWLSVAWGRTLAAGINPYYDVPAAATSWLPLDAPIMRMTYGPLWAYVSAAVMAAAGGHALWGALLFKLLLAALWIALLVVVRAEVRGQTVFEQALAMIMLAWLPIGVGQTVAEGHNDVAMVLCAVLWLRWLRAGRRLPATLALTASVLFKYASAPLFLLDFLYRAPDESRAPARFVGAYLVRGLAAAAVVVVAFAPVFRGLDFFASTADVHGGHFFLPSDAFLALGTITGLPLRALAYGVEGIFPLLTALALYRYLRDGGTAALTPAAASVMMTMLLVGSAHAWPWYVLWYLALAATIPSSPNGRWAMGIALAMPFPLLVWTVAPYASDFKKFHLPSLFAYAIALGWLIRVTYRGARVSAVVQPTTTEPGTPPLAASQGPASRPTTGSASSLAPGAAAGLDDR